MAAPGRSSLWIYVYHMILFSCFISSKYLYVQMCDVSEECHAPTVCYRNELSLILECTYVHFLLNFHWLQMVFNTDYYQNLYNTYKTGWICRPTMEILWRQLKPNAFYAKKKDIIRSE